AGVRLVDRGRGDTRAGIAFEPLLHLLRRRPVGRVRDEEVAVPRIAERGRRVVARDSEDRPLEEWRRLDTAALARRQRHEAGLTEERARLLGPGLVLGANRFGRRRVDAVERRAGLHPVAGSVDVLGGPVRFRRQQLVLLLAALSHLARVRREALRILEQRGVAVR